MTTLADIEDYFDENGIPDEPWQIDSGSVCRDPELMVRTHVSTLKNYSGNPTFLPHWERLLGYYKHLNKRNANQHDKK